MVETFAEHASFRLRDYRPGEPIGGDRVVWNGHVYPFKFPGIAFVGSVPWRIHRLFATGPDDSGDGAWPLVACSTSGVAVELLGALVFRLSVGLGYRRHPALLAAITCGAGSSSWKV
jgi:hypothetical protein